MNLLKKCDNAVYLLDVLFSSPFFFLNPRRGMVTVASKQNKNILWKISKLGII